MRLHFFRRVGADNSCACNPSPVPGHLEAVLSVRAERLCEYEAAKTRIGKAQFTRVCSGIEGNQMGIFGQLRGVLPESSMSPTEFQRVVLFILLLCLPY